MKVSAVVSTDDEIKGATKPVAALQTQATADFSNGPGKTVPATTAKPVIFYKLFTLSIKAADRLLRV